MKDATERVHRGDCRRCGMAGEPTVVRVPWERARAEDCAPPFVAREAGSGPQRRAPVWTLVRSWQNLTLHLHCDVAALAAKAARRQLGSQISTTNMRAIGGGDKPQRRSVIVQSGVVGISLVRPSTDPWQEVARSNGVRIEVGTSLAFDEILSRLRGPMGTTNVPQIVALAQGPISQDEYIRQVEERLVGSSGFMLFNEIDHGGWLAKFGIDRRTVRWILGNPLIAITMIRHDITAGLFAPVEILVTEKETGDGTTVVYVVPSSLMVIGENPSLREAALALDEKLKALVAKATGA
jgi:uncharacterized protein (DUF302 family)